MTVEQALKVRRFSIAWIMNVIAPKNNVYRRKLLGGIDALFPEDISPNSDPFNMLGCKDWDNKEDWGKEWTAPMSDRMSELIECDNVFDFGKTGIDAFRATIRIAIDLFISPSGGVVGFTVGDMKKAFGGTIPEDICSMYERDLNRLGDAEPIWL